MSKKPVLDAGEFYHQLLTTVVKTNGVFDINDIIKAERDTTAVRVALIAERDNVLLKSRERIVMHMLTVCGVSKDAGIRKMISDAIIWGTK